MSAKPKPQQAEGKVYYLGWFVHQRLASTDRIHNKATDAYEFQHKLNAYDNQCYANGYCPLCNGEIDNEEDK